jgi:hypothetical protein
MATPPPEPGLLAMLGVWTKPPAGQCERGRPAIVECCTDVQGHTECRPTGLGRYWPGLRAAIAVRALRQRRQREAAGGGVEYTDPTADDYARARADGYIGTAEEFAADWRLQYEKDRGFIDKQIDDLVDRGQTDWTRIGVWAVAITGAAYTVKNWSAIKKKIGG